MFDFEIPPPTTTPVTIAWQSQHSSVMTSSSSFSSGNRIYHPASVQDEPYIHQWHSGGAERVTPHLYDATTEADVEVSRATIQSRRSAQRIAAYGSCELTLSQSDSMQARLGKEPDASIAADLGISRATLQRHRIAQGIAAYKLCKLTLSQSDSIQARLGKEPDASIAEDFGISRATIQRYRSTQGIAAYKPNKSHNRLILSQLDSIKARLGKESDTSIAADVGVSKYTIQSRRSAQGITASKSRKLYGKLTQSESDSVQARLGKESDASVAAAFGVSETTIRRRRRAQGIAAYEPHKLYKKLTWSKSERVQARLGKKPDATTEADVEESVEAILRRWFEQGSTAYEPCGSHQIHQLQLPNILPETDK